MIVSPQSQESVSTRTTGNLARVGFALEYSLGHITHSDNLKRALATDGGVLPHYVDLPYHQTPGAWARLPGVRSNWSLRASLGAYLGLRRHARALDAALFHTQVTALLSGGFMARVPSVVSLDATPLQYDALGAFYGHAPSGNARVEGLKKRMNERAFAAARGLITWSQWAKDSLVADYGVPAAKVRVIPPGIDTALWDFPRHQRASGPVRLLFVGGDFVRKGGDTLLAALALLAPGAAFEVDIVTKTVDLGEGLLPVKERVRVHRGIAPNSPELLALFAAADLFVFPTRGDCLPLAVLEALSAGLPVVTTAVGAIPEAVEDDHSGRIVGSDDPGALSAALAELIDDHALRAALSRGARDSARSRFDARTNYRTVLESVLAAGASGPGRAG